MRVPPHIPAPLTQDTTPARTGSSPAFPAPTALDPQGPSRDQAGDQATLGASVVSLTRNAMAQPEVRSGLVAHYRAQIASGTYQVASADLADAMLADPQLGLGTGDGG